MVVAHEILLSSPGTGGTLYSLFPGPRSQVPSPSPNRLTIFEDLSEKGKA